ncbi:hypothetical protein R1sor_003250 [Riccia sorocarpa]|uniref:F-box domain-containing protein n=1 Tax=Riccia sorocarpa TaxID=122646 RepID=A0ABD3H1G4_9MARC
MDPEVWKCLLDHEDILRLILCRVSWETNLRLRSVSKAFYAMLSEPSVYTWSLMLTDTSFYTDHSSLEWVDGDINAEHLEQSHANAVCFFSPLKPAERVSEEVTLGRSGSFIYAVVNFELHRWCILPPLGDLPFGNLNDLRVTGVAEGRLLLERTMSEERSEGRHEEDVNPGMGPMGETVFSFGSLTRAIHPELIWNCNHLANGKTQLFQHKGILKRLKLEVVTTSYGLRYERTFGGSIDLHTFDCSSRSWQKEESIGMPRHILESVSSCSKVAGVFGDILCIRNRHVFIFYNFLSKQWCRCDAKELVNFADFEKTGFLWSPKR